MITRDQFMEFFRSDDFYEKMSADDCIEVFATVLKGGSDINADLIEQVCSDYSVDAVSIAKQILHNNGYAVENLWKREDVIQHIDIYAEDQDVSKEIKDYLLEHALNIMNDALQGACMFEQIRMDIDHYWLDHYVQKFLNQKQ